MVILKRTSRGASIPTWSNPVQLAVRQVYHYNSEWNGMKWKKKWMRYTFNIKSVHTTAGKPKTPRSLQVPRFPFSVGVPRFPQRQWQRRGWRGGDPEHLEVSPHPTWVFLRGAGGRGAGSGTDAPSFRFRLCSAPLNDPRLPSLAPPDLAPPVLLLLLGAPETDAPSSTPSGRFGPAPRKSFCRCSRDSSGTVAWASTAHRSPVLSQVTLEKLFNRFTHRRLMSLNKQWLCCSNSFVHSLLWPPSPWLYYSTGVQLQSWRAAVSAGFLVVLSTLGSLKSLIG